MTKTATARPARRAPAAPAETEPRVSLALAAAIYFGLSLLFFLPAFLPDRGIFGTDYLAGGYPFYHFISERLAAGALPKWVPYVFGGMPLFANPGSTYYPIHFLADLVLPVERVFPAVFWVQFGIAGLGMYLLAVELGCRRWIAFVAGLAFQFTGITMSWIYAGHDGRIIVATLAPLFFFFLHRGVRTGGIAPFAGAALTLGFALLSFQIQLSYYLLLAGGIWAVWCLVHFGLHRRPRALATTTGLGLAAVAFGFLLAAVNFLPFLDYVPESPRGEEGGRGYEYSISFSMPPAEALSLAVPEHAGASVSDMEGRPLFPQYRGANPFKLHTEYVGAFVIVLVGVGFYYLRRDRYWWVLAGLGAFMLSIAFGGHTPLYRLYYELLPGTERFRAPSLAFFVVVLCLVTMAALALERLAALRAELRDRRRPESEQAAELRALAWIAGGIAGLALIGALLTAGGAPAAPGTPSIAGGWLRFAVFAALIGGALWAWTRDRLATAPLVIVLAVVTVLDLGIVGRRFFHTVPPPQEMFAADDVMSFLRAQPQPARAWSFPFPQHYRGAGAYGGNYPMLFEVEQVGGEHPNMLRRWTEYVGAGTRQYIDWHNLIHEASVVETEQGPAITFTSAPGFLEAANVRYIVSMAPLAHPSLREVHRGSALVYEHTGALPRAYLVGQVTEVQEDGMVAAMTAQSWDPRATAFVPAGSGLQLSAGPLTGEAEVLLHEPDRVTVRTRADRPALLVLADNMYAGWEARVDGQPAEIVLANHTFRGVAVPAGEHRVEFAFRPADFYYGLYLTVAGFALLALYGVWLLVRRGRAARRAEAAA